jgi:hypothetical protein
VNVDSAQFRISMKVFMTWTPATNVGLYFDEECVDGEKLIVKCAKHRAKAGNAWRAFRRARRLEKEMELKREIDDLIY